jgi:hypothetical protein
MLDSSAPTTSAASSRALELGELVLALRRLGEPPVQVQLIFQFAAAVDPAAAAAHDNGRLAEQGFELRACLLRVLIAFG